MNDFFKIYVDRLKQGQSEKIALEAPSDFLLDKPEIELAFSGNVSIKGEAYQAEEHLVFHLKIKAYASMPCLVCNETVLFPIEIDDFYHAEPLDETQSAIFDYTSLLREAILLQLPSYIECHEGNCPERETLKKYLRKPDTLSTPFKDLDKK